MKVTLDFDIWYKYDIEYIENWSLYFDIKIILKTPLHYLIQKVKKEHKWVGWGIEPTTLSLKGSCSTN